MSFVFLTDRFAYKLEKPVLHFFLDYRSLAQRPAGGK
jgi:aminoglycoside phosphotransferase family enzyme